MSLTKSATRRLSLMAGSSLVAAGLATAASLGLALTPTSAAAQATCISGTAVTNNVSNDVVIAGGNPNNPGITCVYVGDNAMVTLGTPATTVSTAAPGGGINLSATGDDSVNWTSTAATVTGGNQTQGPVIEALTNTGDINLTTGSVTGSNATITHGIRAISSGGGNITMTTGGTVSATSATGSGAVAGGTAGIEARSTGGGAANGDITLQTGAVTGRLHGIIAQVAGAGDLTIVTNNNATINANNTTASIAAMDVVSGTGQVNLTVRGQVTNSNITSGSAIRLTTGGGDAVLNIEGAGVVRLGTSTSLHGAAAAILDFNVGGGGTVTINNNRGGSVGIGITQSGAVFHRALRAAGSGDIVFNNNGRASGSFDLSALTGDFTFNNTIGVDGWSVAGDSIFAQGNNTIANAETGSIYIGRYPLSSDHAAQTIRLDFNTGDDAFTNAGLLVIGMNNATNAGRVAATVVLENLETFTNSGAIVMGSFDRATVGEEFTDGFYDDVLVMRDGHFHGAEGSRILIDAALNNTGQTSCARNVDGLTEGAALGGNAPDAFLPANDCLDFRGSTVSGRTAVLINDIIPGDRGSYNPQGNVLVDVRGADPSGIDPEAFFLSPETPEFVANGGFLDKGLFAYTIGYDAEDQAFKLYGVESPSTMQFSLLGQAANDLWRTATAPWLERRAVQRNEEERGELTPRFWLRGGLSAADRAVGDSIATGVASLDYDTSYTQKDASLAMGMDLIRGEAFGGDWLLGAMAGYAQSRVTYDASVNEATFEGGGVGLYGGFTAGILFSDLVVNATLTNLLIDMPSLNLRPTGTLLESDVSTVGAHMETGLRFVFGALRLEPLASLSWSQSSFDSIVVPADDPVRFGGEVELDDARSTRAGVGVRFVLNDFAPAVLPVDAHFTARSMHELDGETAVTVVNLGPDANLARTFDGAYNELNAGLSVGEAGDHFGAFVNVGGAWGNDYEAKTGSLGFRLRW